MAKDWGIKITKPGVDVTTNDPRNILLSSKYQMFKYHGVYDTSVTFAPGDIYKTAEITHGLGYVPAFIPYVFDDYSDSLQIIPSYPYGIDYPISVSAWADTQKIYFKYDIHGYPGVPAGWNVIESSSSDLWNNILGNTAACWVGKSLGSGADGAVRVTNVNVSSSDTIVSATLNIYINEIHYASSTSRVKWITYGIDEDNTSSFGSDPMGRSRTSATTSEDEKMSEFSVGGRIGTDVTSQVNEIKGRGGWSSGNAMGFLLFNNGSDDGTSFAGYDTYLANHKLTILLSGNLTVKFRAIVFKDKIHA